MIHRRQFISLLGGTAAARPVVARGQQPAMPVIGFLSSGSPNAFAQLVAAFGRGVGEHGYVEGRSVAIASRWAEGQYDRLPALAAELARLPVTVIAASGGAVSANAARGATATIPIVFTGGSDPVKLNLVASLNRPGGNVTGVLSIASGLTAKRLALLRELVPTATTIAALCNPAYPEAEGQVEEIRDAARLIGLQVDFANASDESGFETAFATMVQRRPAGLLIANDPFFLTRRKQLVALAARHAIPTIYAQRQYAEAGGLMSYGTNFAEIYRQAGSYVGRILKGAKPSELPVLQPTKFEFVINLKTAKALGLEIPAKLLALDDEVIE